MESNQNMLNAELQIDATAQAHLAETAKWSNFLAIIGFVLSGLIGLAALFAGTILGNMSSNFGGSLGIFGAGFITVIYLLVAALYFFMSLFLYRFANRMKTALASGDQESLNISFLNLKNLYRMMGILTIVYLSFMVLVFVLAIGTAFMR